MALKLNIRPDLEEEMDLLLQKAGVRSKTEYINRAIDAYNRQLKRQVRINGLRSYFQDYAEEGKDVLREFSRLKTSLD